MYIIFTTTSDIQDAQDNFGKQSLYAVGESLLSIAVVPSRNHQMSHSKTAFSFQDSISIFSLISVPRFYP